MRVSNAQAAETRERILRVAARLFREKGFDGVGVAELMKTAGLTNGAFYSHFQSKDELIAAVCERVLAGPRDPWAALLAGDESLDAFVDTYLSAGHAKARAEGCLFAALGGDVARQTPAARQAFTDNLATSVEALTASSKAGSRESAVSNLATMVGALMLARAVTDPDLSAELLSAARSGVLQG